MGRLGKTQGGAIAAFVVGIFAFSLLVAGCGSDSEATIDKAEFAKQATLICKQASGKLSAEITAFASHEAEHGFHPVKTQTTLVSKTLVPGLEAELRELRALGVPDEAKPEAQAFFNASQKVIDEAKADPKTFAASASPYEAAELAGRQLGVTDCPVAAVTAE